jgi:hypothetical protein
MSAVNLTFAYLAILYSFSSFVDFCKEDFCFFSFLDLQEYKNEKDNNATIPTSKYFLDILNYI